MPRYHLCLGNSSEGPIGFCAAIYASSADEALQTLKDALPESLDLAKWTEGGDASGIEYIKIYFNADAIRTNDIDEVEDEDSAEASASDAGARI